MRSIRRILVAIKDPRARSLPAVAKAAQLARALDARLQLFHGIDTPIYLDMVRSDGAAVTQLERSGRRAHQQRLEAIAARLRRGGVTVSTAVEWDFPAHEAILRNARRFKADLIVAECHATSHHAPWLLRFTDWELLRMSTAPVLLVKNRRPYRQPRVLAAVDPGHAFAKPAKLDEQILRCASAVADAMRGALHVLYAYDPVPMELLPADAGAASAFAQIEASSAARAQAMLERTLRATRLPRAHRFLIARHPIDAIEEAAAESRCSIIVMGAVSRSGLKRLFIGNTAEKVLDHVSCDVLVVKPAHFVSRVPHACRGAQVVALPVMQPGL